MERIIRILGYLDYAGALAGIAWGGFHQSPLWIALGVLGLVVAWISPAKRLNQYLQRKLISRRKLEGYNAFEQDLGAEPPARLQGPPLETLNYQPREDRPYPGFIVCRFSGLDSFQDYASYIGRKFGRLRQ